MPAGALTSLSPSPRSHPTGIIIPDLFCVAKKERDRLEGRGRKKQLVVVAVRGKNGGGEGGVGRVGGR